jgi:hypothetical protein
VKQSFADGYFGWNYTLGGTFTAGMSLVGTRELRLFSQMDDGQSFITLRTGTGAGVEALRVTTAGKVGIGVTGPTKDLEVLGDVQVGTSATLATTYHRATSVTVLGMTPHVWVEARGNVNDYAQIALGYLGATQPATIIGHRITDATDSSKGNLFFATRDVVTDTAPTVRLTIGADGLVTVAGSLTVGDTLTVGGTQNLTGALLGSDDVRAGGGSFIYFASRSLISSPANSTLTLSNQANGAFSTLNYGPPAAAATSTRIQKKVTGIADNAATTVFTVTVPNANHAVGVKLMFVSSNGGADAFESSRVASGMVVIQRNTGVVAVATAAPLDDAAIATNATGGSATHTFAYSVVQAGAAGDPNTIAIQVTIDDSGNTGSNQVVAIAELLNAEATGATIA